MTGRPSLLRLESQMTSDIQAILQLLQRQVAAGPPAYSTVTSSPDYQRGAPRSQCEVGRGREGFFSLTVLQLGCLKSNLKTWFPTELVPDCLPQSPESAVNKSKEPPSVLVHTETLPDQNFEAPTEKSQGLDSVDQQQPPGLPSGRPASLPDVPSTSGLLGLHRPASDPGLPGK